MKSNPAAFFLIWWINFCILIMNFKTKIKKNHISVWSDGRVLFIYRLTYMKLYHHVCRSHLHHLHLSFRAHLCSLPDGGKHLRRLRHHWLPGGSLLLHLPAAQAANPAANPLLSAQLPGRDHPHDPDHGSSEPACSVSTVQHGHHQLQLGWRGKLHPQVFSGGSGPAAAAAWLPCDCHCLLFSLHSHSDPTDSTTSTTTSPLHITTGAANRRPPAPTAAPPSAHSEHQLPASSAVLLPPAARRLHSNQGLCRLWTELTGIPAGVNRGLQELLDRTVSEDKTWLPSLWRKGLGPDEWAHRATVPAGNYF